jgi:uncharacterized protein DUF5372
VTHPFHPLSGRQLRRIGESANGVGRRVVCAGPDGVAWAVPIEWTDLAEHSAEFEHSDGRAYFLVGDLLALAGLVARVQR